jgi:hypothetical protein
MSIASSLPRPTPRRSLLIGSLAVVASAFLAGGCGSSSPSSTSSKASPTPTKAAQIANIDACKLVTAAEASAAVNTTVTNLAAASGASIPGACIYGSQDGVASVFVFAQAYPDSTTADNISPDQMAAILNGQYGVSNARAVNGIGDKAFEYTATSASASGSGIAIFVFKANAVIMIVMSPATDSRAVEVLARTAVGRL